MTLQAAFAGLLPQLQPHQPSPYDLVPRLASALTAFVLALDKRLTASADDDSDGFADCLLERLNARGGTQTLEIIVEAARKPPPQGPRESRLEWHPYHRGSLRFEVPLAHDYGTAPHIVTTIVEALASDEASTAAGEAATAEGAGDAGNDDASEWEGIATPSQSAASVLGGWSRGPTPAEVARGVEASLPPERMPAATDEPKRLFAQRPPYLMQIVTRKNDELLVTCSHQKTLEALMQYLQRYVRIDRTTGVGSKITSLLASEQTLTDAPQSPLLKITLKESFLAGPLYDTLKIETWDARSLVRNDLPAISPVLVLSFVESVLGYRCVGDVGEVLMYRRDGAFEW